MSTLSQNAQNFEVGNTCGRYISWGVYRYQARPVDMRATKMLRAWDRKIADFVEIPILRSLDDNLSCIECRYYDEDTKLCQGVGSTFYQKTIPYPEFVPRGSECEVRLPPDLLSFV